MAQRSTRWFSAMTAAALVMALPAPAFAAAASDALAPEVTSLAPNRFLWNDSGSSEPVSIVVSIPIKRPMSIAARC